MKCCNVYCIYITTLQQHTTYNICNNNTDIQDVYKTLVRDYSPERLSIHIINILFLTYFFVFKRQNLKAAYFTFSSGLFQFSCLDTIYIPINNLKRNKNVDCRF